MHLCAFHAAEPRFLCCRPRAGSCTSRTSSTRGGRAAGSMLSPEGEGDLTTIKVNFNRQLVSIFLHLRIGRMCIAHWLSTNERLVLGGGAAGFSRTEPRELNQWR